MYGLMYRGALGNRVAQWPTFAEVPEGPVGVREVGKPGGLFVCTRTREEAARVVAAHPGKHLTFSEVAPDEVATLYAEALLYGGELVLCGALGTGRIERFRDAMQRASTVKGLRALMVVRAHCWPADAEDLLGLLDAYPGHVVEFTAFERAVGVCRGRNTVIWEVRHY